jgi:hypothetical protein
MGGKKVDERRFPNLQLTRPLREALEIRGEINKPFGILQQREVNALLGAIDAGGDEMCREQVAKEVRAYNRSFRRIPEILRQVYHERFTGAGYARRPNGTYSLY